MSQSSRITPEHRNIFTGLHRGLNRNNGTYALRVACSNSVVTVTTPVVSATRKQLKAATATHPPPPAPSVRPWDALGMSPDRRTRCTCDTCGRARRNHRHGRSRVTATRWHGRGQRHRRRGLSGRRQTTPSIRGSHGGRVAGEAWRHHGLVLNDVGLKRKQTRENEETNAHILLMMPQLCKFSVHHIGMAPESLHFI